MNASLPDPLLARHPLIADYTLDGLLKGIPPRASLRLADVGAQGWNLLRGDLPMPAAILRTDILARNSDWMMRFCHAQGLDLCPHGKTTMAPQLWALQLADGCWGITVATVQQLQVALRFGVTRAILANQPVGALAADACIAALSTCDLHVLADSEAVVAGLAAAARRAPPARPLKVLVEVGPMGGRTGARTTEQAIAVARAVAAAPGLVVAGVEAFEGVLTETAAVDAFLDGLVATAKAIAAEGLFGTDEVLLTAGGTAFFDRIGPRFAGADLGRKVRRVLRSGCYITHDSAGYEDSYRRMRAEAALDFPDWDLQPALEIWAAVQSRPEPKLAILTLGKRDISFDSALPLPRFWFRPGAMEAPQPLAFHKVRALNDQHGYCVGPDNTPLQVGDLVCLGIGHPCLTFDRWQVMLLAGADYTVTGAIRTFF